jgi:hypothetical protein
MTGEEPGYLPSEIERGEDQAWHIPVWGCVAAVILLLLLVLLVVKLSF